MNPCRRCDWKPNHEAEGSSRQQLAQHALDVGHPLCPLCTNSQTETDPRWCCEACLTATRTTLADIVALWAELPAHLRTVAGSALGGTSGGGGNPLPGGAVLALLGPGSAGGSARRLTRTDLAAGLDGREHRHDNRPDDTPSVAWTLGSWVEDWMSVRGDTTGTTVLALAGYLDTHARWAANQHPAFTEYAADLADLHATLEVATHRRRRPTRLSSPCFLCTGTLVRKVDTDTGLEAEHATCTSCATTYTPVQYGYAVRAAAEWLTLDGETYGTVAALSRELAVPERTVRTWRARERVRSQMLAGVVFVHVQDTRDLHGEGAGSDDHTGSALGDVVRRS